MERSFEGLQKSLAREISIIPIGNFCDASGTRLASLTPTTTITMESNAFPSVANIHLASHSRLVRESCCPDKDLVIVLSRLGGLERISLWNSNQGTKIWETDVGDESTSTHVAGLCWSPDGQVLLNYVIQFI